MRVNSHIMKNKGLKIGLTSLVLTLTFGGLLYTTLAEGTEYYKHVEEVIQPAIQAVDGVSGVNIYGQARRQIVLVMNEPKITALGLMAIAVIMNANARCRQTPACESHRSR